MSSKPNALDCRNFTAQEPTPAPATRPKPEFPQPPINGIHAWLLAAAWWCRRDGLTSAEALQRIESYDGTQRRPLKPNEASGAVSKAYNCKLDPSVRFERMPKPPSWNSDETGRLHREMGTEVVDLLVLSPEFDPPMIPPSVILAKLFPDPETLLCVGQSKFRFKTAPLRDHKRLWQKQFICPAPMTTTWGITQEGNESMHAKSNTGPRRYIVCDFDNPPPEQHPSIILHLAKFRPLVMALSSGGRSLHAWFPATASSGDDRIFWRMCIALGADPALYRNRSQFVRMPNGTRDNGKRQHCTYFNPAAIP